MTIHVLMIEDEAGELSWSIIHPVTCPEIVLYENPLVPDDNVIGRDCAYEHETSNIGAEAFVPRDGGARGLPAEPGEYLIEWESNGQTGDWFDSWIRVTVRVWRWCFTHESRPYPDYEHDDACDLGWVERPVRLGWAGPPTTERRLRCR